MSWLSDDEKRAVKHETKVFAFGTACIVIVLEGFAFAKVALVPLSHALIIIVALIAAAMYDEQAYTGRNVTKLEKIVRFATNVLLCACLMLVSGPVLTRLFPPPPTGRVAIFVYNVFGYGLVFAMYRSILLFVPVVLSSLL